MDNIIQAKSYDFAVKMIRLYQHLSRDQREFVLSKQLLRSGTSIGANIEEAIGGQSERDFFAKLNISYKEARETVYWLRLLQDTGYLTPHEAKPLIEDAEELIRILAAIIKTLRKKLKPGN